jgi:hypothetical protein
MEEKVTPPELTSGTPSMVVCELSQVTAEAKLVAWEETSSGSASEPVMKQGFCLLGK